MDPNRYTLHHTGHALLATSDQQLSEWWASKGWRVIQRGLTWRGALAFAKNWQSLRRRG